MIWHHAVSRCEHDVFFRREGDAARAEGDAKVEEARDASAQAAQVMPSGQTVAVLFVTLYL